MLGVVFKLRVFGSRPQSSGPRTARIRNGRRRQEWVCVCRGTSVDGRFRLFGVLQSQNSPGGLLKRLHRTIHPADYFRPANTRRDQLHDVEGTYLTDDDDHNLGNFMFCTPPLEGKTWGADLPKSPVMLNPQFKGAQPIDVFVVLVGTWSDGSAAPVMSDHFHLEAAHSSASRRVAGSRN
jgi:hypothetical protein